jgi:Bacterial PH domain
VTESAPVKYRNAALVLAALVIAVAVYFSLGPPRVLWLNAGLTLAHESGKGVSALVAAAAAAAIAYSAGSRAAQVIAGIAALALAVFGVHLLVYRVDAVEEALSRRTLLGTTRIPWKAVTRVDSTPGHFTAVADTTAIRIGTASLSADERAALERTVARRLREADGPAKVEGGPTTAR